MKNQKDQKNNQNQKGKLQKQQEQPWTENSDEYEVPNVEPDENTNF